MTITHTFTSPKADGADNTLVQPSDWNAAHTLAAGYTFLRTASVTLTDAQIKTLGNGGTDVELIPAPGENKIICFFGAIAVLNATAGAYSGTNDSVLQVWIGGSMTVSGLMKFPTSADVNTMYFSPLSLQPAGIPAAGNYQSQIFNLPVSSDTAYANRPLVLTDWWAPGEYGGGHASNTMKITAFYALADAV